MMTDLPQLGEDDERVRCLRAAYAAISRGDIDRRACGAAASSRRRAA